MYLRSNGFIRLIQVLICICISYECICQNQADRLYFDHLSIQEGLSHNSVFSILQDSHGYIWIGTQNGLNKYDAYSFEIFRSPRVGRQQEGFVGQHILALFEDSHQNLWVGTENNGINFKARQHDSFTNLLYDPKFEDIMGFGVSSFTEDSKGNIWISSIGGGLLKYNMSESTSEHYTSANSALINNVVFGVAEDVNGSIWVATAGEGINLLTENNQFININPDPQLVGDLRGYRKSLLMDGEFLWITSDETGLFRMNITDRTFEQFEAGPGNTNLSSNSVYALAMVEEGQMFIGTDGAGLNIMDVEKGTIQKLYNDLSDPSSLNSNAVQSIMKDQGGNIWIGTFNGGLNVVKRAKTWFDIFNSTNSNLENASILDILELENGDIWLSTDGGGINWIKSGETKISNDKLIANQNSNNSIASNVVKTCFEDSKGNIWIGTFREGVDVYNTQTKRIRHYESKLSDSKSLSNNNVWSIIERHNGQIWLGTLGGGINIYDEDSGSFEHLRNESNDDGSLIDDAVIILLEDSQHNVWAGTSHKGLERWNDEQGVFEHFQFDLEDPNSISGNDIRAIYEDSRNRLWIGTEGGGLNIWDGDAGFKRIQRSDGLIANSVMGITEDSDGLIWVTTFQGISRIGPKLTDIINFDFHSNARNNQFNQMSILTSKKGKLYFGGINGLHSIYPEKIRSDIFDTTKIRFTDLEVLGNRISPGKEYAGIEVLTTPIEFAEEIHLKHSDKFIKLNFSSFDYANPKEKSYEYMMEGFESEWHETSKGQNSVTYTNLDPGDYVFKIRYEDKESELAVYISPPFWERLWFKIVSVLFMLSIPLGILWYSLRKRTEQHKQQLLMKEREILELKNKSLEGEVVMTNSKLLSSTAQMAHKNEILTDIKEDLKKAKEEKEIDLRRIIRKIDMELQSEDYWKEFNQYFDKVDRNFIQSMLKKHPDMTKNDLRLCALIRINLSTKEIASMLNISVRGAEKSKYRLKKRLELDKEQNLSRYIRSFDQALSN